MINHAFSILAQYIDTTKYKESATINETAKKAIKSLIATEEDVDCCLMVVYSSIFGDVITKYDNRLTFDLSDLTFMGNFTTWRKIFLSKDVTLGSLLEKATSDELIQLKELKADTDKIAFYINLVVRIASA